MYRVPAALASVWTRKDVEPELQFRRGQKNMEPELQFRRTLLASRAVVRRTICTA
jgi:hypothetical protein